MLRFIQCMTVEHDWRFVAGAVLLCVVGLSTTVGLMSLARSAASSRSALYGMFAAMVASLTVWATHFIAMMGYVSGVQTRYEVGPTLLSLGIVSAGFAASMILALGRRGPWWRALSGMAAAASVAAMHFVGLAGVHLTGMRITLDPVGVAVVVGLGLGIAALTGLLKLVRPSWRKVAGAGLGIATVAVLHFGSMAAVVLVPSPNSSAMHGMTELVLLACLVIVVLAVIGIAGFVTAVAYWSRSNSLAQFREAIDAMPDGLGFYDANDRLIVWNARYSEFHPEIASNLCAGISFEQMVRVGLNLDLYIDAEGRKEEWLAERLAARRQLSSTLEQHLVGDQWLRVQDRRTSAGGTVTVVNDITDLKRDARALSEARDAADAANRAKSAFLANMSHEIRTPLNGVVGLAQALARTELTPAQTEMLSLIQSSGHTLQTLLSDILDLARVESGRLEIAHQPYSLSRAVTEAAQLYAASAADKGLQFFVDIEPEADVWVMGDVVRVKQIITNLVSNAVKFTTLGFVSLLVARSVSADGSPALRFTVEDTGVGFAANARDRLFNRFEQADDTITRRFGGTGLGLAICRQLAEMMQGELDCESEPGGGSAFILTLPLVETEPPAASNAVVGPAPPPTDEAPLRVLVADDHPTNRRVVELILAEANVVLTSVEDGAKALTAFREQAFDLVLMDMQMPVMDGLTATREIRDHEASTGGERTPIVMLTANALAEHVAASHEAGADTHLSKPFSAEALLGLVAAAAAQVGERLRAAA